MLMEMDRFWVFLLVGTGPSLHPPGPHAFSSKMLRTRPKRICVDRAACRSAGIPFCIKTKRILGESSMLAGDGSVFGLLVGTGPSLHPPRPHAFSSKMLRTRCCSAGIPCCIKPKRILDESSMFCGDGSSVAVFCLWEQAPHSTHPDRTRFHLRCSGLVPSVVWLDDATNESALG